MKKTDTIALYLDEYMSGKSEEDKNKFLEKPVDKQYAAIMAWKRRKEISGATGSPASPAAMLEVLKKIKKAIPELDSLSQKDSEKLRTALNEIIYDIDNFDKIKKAQLLRALEDEKDRISRQGEDLDRKIEALRQELC